LHSEPLLSNEEKNHGDGRETIMSPAKQRSSFLFLRHTWTIFGSYLAFLGLFIILGALQPRDPPNDNLEPFIIGQSIASIASMVRLRSRFSFLPSLSIYQSYTFSFLAMIGEKKDGWLLTFFLLPPALVMGYMYRLYQPHTSDTRFFQTERICEVVSRPEKCRCSRVEVI
jgi:hypothetical protein